MRKIPGTLFKIDVKGNDLKNLSLEIFYREEEIAKFLNLNKSQIIKNIEKILTDKGIDLPLNQITNIVNFELKRLNIITADDNTTAINGPISDMEKALKVQEGIIEILQSKEEQKIIIMGLSNAGKTCIHERIFEGKKPNELLQSAATKGISYKEYEIGFILKPVVWDLGGQKEYLNQYHTTLRERIFKKVDSLLFVIDANDIERIDEAKIEFDWILEQIIKFNESAKIYVLFHKMDIVPDKETTRNKLKNDFYQKNLKKINYFYTSIFDDSLFYVWSEIIRDLSSKTVDIDELLSKLTKSEEILESVLLDRSTNLIIGSSIKDANKEQEILGASSMIMFTLNNISNDIGFKNFHQISITSEDGSILFFNISKDLMIVVLCEMSDFDSNLYNKIKLQIDSIKPLIIDYSKK